MTKTELLFNFYWLAYIVMSFVIGTIACNSLIEECRFWLKARIKNSKTIGIIGTFLAMAYTGSVAAVTVSMGYSILLWRGSPLSEELMQIFSNWLFLLYGRIPFSAEFSLEVQLLGAALLLQFTAVLVKPFVNYKLNSYNKNKSQQLIAKLQDQALSESDKDESKTSTFIKYY